MKRRNKWPVFSTPYGFQLSQPKYSSDFTGNLKKAWKQKKSLPISSISKKDKPKIPAYPLKQVLKHLVIIAIITSAVCCWLWFIFMN